MSSTTEGSELTFPEVNASSELNLRVPERFPVDSISSDVTTAKELKEEAEARARAAAVSEKSDLGSTLMSALVVSGVVLAAIGVAFFVTKQLRNT